MIAMNRDVMTTVAVIAALAMCIYLFRELTKAKEDVESLKGVSTKLMQVVSEPPKRMMMMPRPPPRAPPPKQDEPSDEADEEEPVPVARNSTEN
jgi:hypothetical protein